MYGVPVSGFWRDSTQSDDCIDGFFRIYAGREDGAADWIFLRNPGRYFLCQCHRVLRFTVHVYRLYERKFAVVFYPQDIKLPVALILCSDFFYGIICYVILFLLRSRFDVMYYLVHIILPEIVYTIVVTLLLYPLILWINTRLEHGELRSGKKFV